MRKKTMKNDLFYPQYPYRPELELADNVSLLFIIIITQSKIHLLKLLSLLYLQRQLKYKVATSFDSKLYFTYCQLPPRVLCEPDAVFDANKSTDKGDVSGSPAQSPTEHPPTLSRFVYANWPNSAY